MGLFDAIFEVVKRLVCGTEPSKPEYEPERPHHQQHHPVPYHPPPAKPAQPVKPAAPPAHRPPKPPSPGRVHKRYVGPHRILQDPKLKT